MVFEWRSKIKFKSKTIILIGNSQPPPPRPAEPSKIVEKVTKNDPIFQKIRIPEVKLWLIIELKSSNFQSTVLLNFIPEFENLEIFSPAAILIIFKNIHQTLQRNSELHFNDLNCKKAAYETSKLRSVE